MLKKEALKQKAGIFALFLIVLLVVTLSACGGGSSPVRFFQIVPADTAPESESTPPANDETETPDPGTSGEESEGGDANKGEDLSGQSVWWVNPDTGEAGYIIEGYASIGLEYFPGWVIGPPVDAEAMNDEFVNHPTIQALLDLGYELLMPYGIIMAGEFKLPPGVTFAEAREFLLDEFADIAYVDPWSEMQLF